VVLGVTPSVDEGLEHARGLKGLLRSATMGHEVDAAVVAVAMALKVAHANVAEARRAGKAPELEEALERVRQLERGMRRLWRGDGETGEDRQRSP
jgi:hypothetical protein